MEPRKKNGALRLLWVFSLLGLIAASVEALSQIILYGGYFYLQDTGNAAAIVFYVVSMIFMYLFIRELCKTDHGTREMITASVVFYIIACLIELVRSGFGFSVLLGYGIGMTYLLFWLYLAAMIVMCVLFLLILFGYNIREWILYLCAALCVPYLVYLLYSAFHALFFGFFRLSLNNLSAVFFAAMFIMCLLTLISDRADDEV